MLPTSTQQRTQRESSQGQRNARSVEISRLISRCLRTTVDLAALGERSIFIDCDVLQADGGTRTACITAASRALNLAALRWQASGTLDANVLKEDVAALSAGIIQGQPLVDLAYDEDSAAQADFNFVLTQQGAIIEIQGTGEKAPVSIEAFEQLKRLTLSGIQELFRVCQAIPFPTITQRSHQPKTEKQGPFSLGNRIGKTLETRQ